MIMSAIAALNTATNGVIAQCQPRRLHQEFLGFLRHGDQAAPTDLDVHLIIDDHAPHKHPKVKAWLARHTLYLMHFTPTRSNWLNQVEWRVGLNTRWAIRRGAFKNVRQLIASIERYTKRYQQQEPAIRMAPDRRFTSPESGSTMQSYFRD
ncbi:transposase [Paraburkholderia tropica]|uniref:transposase n=1 Tax=Paraburkholderia tropica TaxID=92647 RepID=UPI0017EF26D0|nr:transposase [Paraburkholderia tropica]MBB3001511.1 hypothetical protein [Paraburkholderia tropica]MBB6322828.1 hypothetical protein [Paraburkholderia tropica]